MDNPVQVKRSTGLRDHDTRNCVAVQHVHVKDKSFQLNCYAVRWWAELYPVLHFRLHGVIHVNVLRTWYS
ncbi:MAG: hypothetical protein LBL39_07500 [Planctomycetaceae bacterium]|nr:hypothetical protein [Planctomycetaceae bacterium]